MELSSFRCKEKQLRCTFLTFLTLPLKTHLGMHREFLSNERQMNGGRSMRKIGRNLQGFVNKTSALKGLINP